MQSSIWNHFEKIPDSHCARCIMCKKKYSYKTTITNLKKHLNIRHSSAHDDLIKNDKKYESKKGIKYIKEPRKYKPRSSVWDLYEKIPDKLTALCKLCHEEYSYKTSTTNLKKHLRVKHEIAYLTLIERQNYKAEVTDGSDDRFKGTTGNLSVHLKRYHEEALDKIKEAADSNDDHNLESDEDGDSLHQQDIYFEEEDDQVKCTVCGKNISEDGEDPRSHLEEHHPGLLARIIKNEDQAEEEEEVEAEEDDEMQNEKDVFTEVVYLDQVTPPQSQKRSARTKKSTSDSVKKRKLSTDSGEYLIKTKKNKEIESFTNYIRILLEKLPQDVFSRLQLEIINLIMAAQFNLSSNSTANVASTASTSVAVDNNRSQEEN